MDEGRDNLPDDQQLLKVKEDVPHLLSSSLDQQESKLLHIKQEKEELWGSLEGEPFPVTSEDDEKPQLFQLHQIKTEDNRETEPSIIRSVEQMKIEPDGENCGGPEPDRNQDHLQPKTDEKASDSADTEVTGDDGAWGESMSDCDEDWKEMRRPGSGIKSNEGHKVAKKFFSSLECCEQFVYKNSLQKHVTSHSAESSPSLFFKKCSRKKQTRVNSREKRFACDECGKRFCKKQQIEYHMRRHTGEKPYACNECYKAFSNLQILKKHMKYHKGEKPFQCDGCGKTFSSLGNLKQHMSLHTGEKPFACCSCDKSFRRCRDLDAHMMRHRGEKPFICSVCGARFSREGNLSKHFKIHTGERPFNCDICDKKFLRKADLKKHIPVHLKVRKVSTAIRRFACDVCGKTFVQSSHLSVHKVVHTGKKTFSCDVCGVSFTRRDSLNRHHMKLHNK